MRGIGSGSGPNAFLCKLLCKGYTPPQESNEYRA